jgi:hypothetical protein
MRRICFMVVASATKPRGRTMTTRWNLWLGASALAMASGALPAAQIVSPITSSLLGVDLIDEAQAQESGEGEGS